jgi:hypothetical protein
MLYCLECVLSIVFGHRMHGSVTFWGGLILHKRCFRASRGRIAFRRLYIIYVPSFLMRRIAQNAGAVPLLIE